MEAEAMERRPVCCRRLFGPTDPTRPSPLEILQTMEREIRKKDKERWNFDFERGKPLPGRLQWEKVILWDRENVPVNKLTSSVISNTDVVEVKKCKTDNSKKELKRKKRATKGMDPSAGAMGLKCKKITDFLLYKKRASTTQLRGVKPKRARPEETSVHTAESLA